MTFNTIRLWFFTLMMFFSSGFFCQTFAAEDTAVKGRTTKEPAAKADRLYAEGNYREAFELYKAVLLESGYDTKTAEQHISNAVNALRHLGAESKFDAFIESVVQVHESDWRVLTQAAVQYREMDQYGHIVAGEFIRGPHRGGQAEYVNSSERDRARALQLLQRALEQAGHDSGAGDDNVKRTLREMSRTIIQNRTYQQAWKLQHLTDLSQLPDYDDYHYEHYDGERGAPVDENGNPVFYALPESFASAKNDGERWRYLLNEIASYSETDRQASLWQWADFLWQQFGVQTIADTPWFNDQDMDEETDRAKSIYRLNTLKEDETIARLANGIKRFTLPDEHNPIKIFQELAERGDHATPAIERLATIYENRRQLKTAAAYWKRGIEKFHSRDPSWRERLDQIVGAWARFEPKKIDATDSDDSAVLLRFRNASSVKFTIHELHAGRFLEDLKNHLASNPDQLEWEKLHLSQIGYRILYEKQRRYLGKKLKTWTRDLEPSEQHYDRRVEVKLPEGLVGPYLLEATVAGGNTIFIVVWNTESIIVNKPMDKREWYFLADSATGKPRKNTTLNFIGYRQQWWDHDNNANTRERHRILTKAFSVKTDDSGEVELSNDKLDRHYQWLVHTDSSKKGFAHLGFDSIWYRPLSRAEYNTSKAYVITNQPAYRPGQPVKFKIWLRKASYDQTDRSIHANKKFSVIIRNPRGEEVLNRNFTTDDYGGLDGEFQLDQNAGLGRYFVQVHGISGGNYFLVEEYKKPEFEVVVEAPSEPVQLGDRIETVIKANYLFGAPVVNARVKYKVMRYKYSTRWYPASRWDWLYGRGYWWFCYDAPWYPGWERWGIPAQEKSWWGPSYDPPELVMENDVEIGTDGIARIVIDTESAKLLHGDSDHRYEITAEVTDQSRRTIIGSGEVLVARKPYQVYVWLDKGYYDTGDVVKANFSAQTLANKPVEGKGEVKLYRVDYRNDQVSEQLVQSWWLNTSSWGESELTFKANNPGQHRLVYVLEDKQGNRIEGGYLFNVIGETSVSRSDAYLFNDLELIPDKKNYSPGEKVRLLINSNHPDAHVLLFLRPQNEVYRERKLVRLNGKSRLVDINIETADMPNFFVEAVVVKNGQVFTEVREVTVPPENRVLDMELIPGKEKYLPGEKARLKIRLSDEQGKPFVGSTVIAVYDKALEYISAGGNMPGIREFFWQWRREHRPVIHHSAQTVFANMARKDDKTMEQVGMFGDRLLTDDAWTEEPVVESFLDSLKRSQDVTRKFAGVVAADIGVFPDKAVAEPVQRVAGVDMDNFHETIQIRKEFSDSAFWKSGITTNKQGIAEVEFNMPENLTTWKASAWAMGHGTKIGQASADLITSKNLLLRMQAPRFFVEKDEVVLSANIHNYLDSNEKVEARIELEGQELQLSGDAQQELTVASNGEKRIDWRVKVLREGEVTVRMFAVGEHESDAMEMRFPVYVHGMLKTESFSGTLSNSQNSGVIEFTVPKERRPEQTRFELRYSPTLAGALVDALPYLVSYPYGCTEQTLSRFLPTVMVRNVLKQTGVALDDIRQKQANLNAQEIGDNAERAEQWRQRGWQEYNPVFDHDEVNNMVEAGLTRLYSMQLSDGGWGWFSGWGERSWPHTTAHVLRGFQVAKQSGLPVDENVYRRGMEWLHYHQAQEVQKIKNAESKISPYKVQANNLDALIALIIATDNVKQKNTAAMLDFLYRDRQHLSVYGKTLLALALHKFDRITERDQVRGNIEQFLVRDDENQTAYLNLKNSGYWWYWYGDDIETHAYYLKLLTRIDPQNDIAPRLVKYLLNNRKHASYWNSTRDTALVIEAMADYLVASGESNPELTLDLILDGRKIKSVKLNKDNLFDFDNKLVLEGDQLDAGNHSIQIVKRGSGPLYYNASLDNFTLEDFISKAGLEVKVERRYYLLKPIESTVVVRGSRGQALEQQQEKYQRIPVERDHPLKSGDLVEIELIIESKNDYEYILIEDMKAAGFEPLEVRSGYNGNEIGAYVEYRDNRVAFFVTRLAHGRHSVSYRLKAEIPGSFSALPARVEAMYAPEIKANSDEVKLSITD